MGSKQKSQQKLPRQNTKTIRDASQSKYGPPRQGKTVFKGHR